MLKEPRILVHLEEEVNDNCACCDRVIHGPAVALEFLPEYGHFWFHIPCVIELSDQVHSALINSWFFRTHDAVPG